MSELLSGPHGFHILPYKPVASQIYLLSLSVYSSSACIINNRAKTLDDAKVHN